MTRVISFLVFLFRFSFNVNGDDERSFPFFLRRKRRIQIFFGASSLKVRLKGLEPPRLSAPDPKSGAATNYATTAECGHKSTSFFLLRQIFIY